MRNILISFSAVLCVLSGFGQRTTENDGDWATQYLVLRNTPEADLMIRVGDIDNLGFGFGENFNPFSGRSTDSHWFPWNVNKSDARGTDRIMVPSAFVYFTPENVDGYTSSTIRPGNKPIPISIPIADLKTVTIDSAALQLFIDDFQSPVMGSRFQVKLNGLRFTEAEKLISKINQTGPIGKLITLKLTPEFLQKLSGDSLVIFIDDPSSKNGDGYAIDFVKLLINPRMMYKGKIAGHIIDAETHEPIPYATAAVQDIGLVQANESGYFVLDNIPAGLSIVTGSHPGYASSQKQVDVIADETTEEIEIELKKSGKVTFNNKTLREGDDMVLNNIQFDVNSAVLKPAGKTELDKLSGFMRQNSAVEIQLSGHTSSEGSASANRELSLKRVRSCKDYLVSKGIDDGRIIIRGFGPDNPISPNDTEANRAKNRRVEMSITSL